MIGLVLVDGCIIIVKGLFRGIRPDPIDSEFAETLANKSIERRVGPVLGTTFNNHVDELDLDGTN
jgi:hypothetical protein